jgi:hypothetical protein
MRQFEEKIINKLGGRVVYMLVAWSILLGLVLDWMQV